MIFGLKRIESILMEIKVMEANRNLQSLRLISQRKSPKKKDFLQDFWAAKLKKRKMINLINMTKNWTI